MMSTSLSAKENPTPTGLSMNNKLTFLAQVSLNSINLQSFGSAQAYGPIFKNATGVLGAPGPPSKKTTIGSVSGLFNDSMKI